MPLAGFFTDKIPNPADTNLIRLSSRAARRWAVAMGAVSAIATLMILVPVALYVASFGDQDIRAGDVEEMQKLAPAAGPGSRACP